MLPGGIALIFACGLILFVFCELKFKDAFLGNTMQSLLLGVSPMVHEALWKASFVASSLLFRSIPSPRA